MRSVLSGWVRLRGALTSSSISHFNTVTATLSSRPPLTFAFAAGRAGITDANKRGEEPASKREGLLESERRARQQCGELRRERRRVEESRSGGNKVKLGGASVHATSHASSALLEEVALLSSRHWLVTRPVVVWLCGGAVVWLWCAAAWSVAAARRPLR